MKLVTDNYTFPIHVEPPVEWDPIINVYVGNPNHKPKSCIDISVFDDQAILQDVEFMESCSMNKLLKQGNETVEMIRASLKWIASTYTNINYIDLTDKSYIPLQSGYHMPLPEYYMLVHGTTWYQQHLNAIPISDTTEHLMNSYDIFRYMSVKDTPLVAYVDENDHNKQVHQVIGNIMKHVFNSDQEVYQFMKQMRLRPLTGHGWRITRETALNYPLSVAINDEQTGGSLKKMLKKMNAYIIPYYHK